MNRSSEISLSLVLVVFSGTDLFAAWSQDKSGLVFAWAVAFGFTLMGLVRDVRS